MAESCFPHLQLSNSLLYPTVSELVAYSHQVTYHRLIGEGLKESNQVKGMLTHKMWAQQGCSEPGCCANMPGCLSQKLTPNICANIKCSLSNRICRSVGRSQGESLDCRFGSVVTQYMQCVVLSLPQTRIVMGKMNYLQTQTYEGFVWKDCWLSPSLITENISMMANI